MKDTSFIFLASALLILFTVNAQSGPESKIEIINRGPNADRIHDTDGYRMDVHDGKVLDISRSDLDTLTIAKLGLPDDATRVFFFYGMGYGNCTETKELLPPQNCGGMYRTYGEADENASCGFNLDHAHNLYTSLDLKNWTYQGDVFSSRDALSNGRPEGIYFRVKVVYNRNLKQYVLWTNYLPPPPKDAWSRTPFTSYPKATYVVATSNNPLGPFNFQRIDTSLTQPGGGDFDILTVDESPGVQTAYIAYDAWGKVPSPWEHPVTYMAGDHIIRIEQLTDDFQFSTQKMALPEEISPRSNEASMLFGPVDGLFYLAYGHTCCFCSPGSGAHIKYATHPMGPWTSMQEPNDINCQQDSWLGGCASQTVKAQNSFVVTVRNAVALVDGQRPEGIKDMFIYVGDLWASAPDKLKGHDLQQWEPLHIGNRTIALLHDVESFEFQFLDTAMETLSENQIENQ